MTIYRRSHPVRSSAAELERRVTTAEEPALSEQLDHALAQWRTQRRRTRMPSRSRGTRSMTRSADWWKWR
jgi:hypothetical protein